MQKVIEQEVSFVHDKSKNKKNNTGAEMQKDASKLRFAEPGVIYVVSNGVMMTRMELDTVRTPMCRENNSLDMSHHAFQSPHLCL